MRRESRWELFFQKHLEAHCVSFGMSSPRRARKRRPCCWRIAEIVELSGDLAGATLTGQRGMPQETSSFRRQSLGGLDPESDFCGVYHPSGKAQEIKRQSRQGRMVANRVPWVLGWVIGRTQGF